MTFLNNIPQPTDFLSSAQADLLANNQFLGDTTTRSGVTSGISTGGYYKLPNGLYIQYFKTTSVANNSSVPFLTAFPNAVISIHLQAITGSTSTDALYVASGTVTTSQFDISASRTWNQGIYVLAIGY
jgi:hypothetical protein